MVGRSRLMQRVLDADGAPIKEKKAGNGAADGAAASKGSRAAAAATNGVGGSRSSRGRHRARGNAAGRSRSDTRPADLNGSTSEFPEFVGPMFTTGLADYGTQVTGDASLLDRERI